MKDPKQYYRNKGNKKYKQRFKRERYQDPEFVIRGDKVLLDELRTDDYWNPFGTKYPIDGKDLLQGRYFRLNEEEEFNSRIRDEYDFDESYLFDDGYEDTFELNLLKFEKNLIYNLQEAFIKSVFVKDKQNESIENRLLKHHETIKGTIISAKNFQALFPNNHQIEFDKSQILSAIKNYLGYLKLVLFSPFWINSPADWKKETGKSIGEFVFAQYQLPAVFHKIWEVKSNIPIDYYYWYILMAQGGSIKRFSRSAKLKLHEATINKLYQVQEDMPIVNAFTFARVLSKGGDLRDYTLFSNAYLTDYLVENDSFEIKSLEWMVKYGKEFSDQEYLLILNWAKHENSEFERTQHEYRMIRGRRRLRPKIDEDIQHDIEEDNHHVKPFSWKGRKPNRTLERAINYYQSIVNSQEKFLSWEPNDFNWTYTDENSVEWSFNELISSQELNDEGRKLLHCVGSYAFSCSEGMSAIISLKKNKESTLTIEIKLGLNKIIQVRGFSNRLPVQEEKTVLTAWIKEKGLTVNF